MTCRGRVQGGVIVLDSGAHLPEGAEVRVELLDRPRSEAIEQHPSPLFQAGDRAKSTGIPDLAENHDHYLYGHPKVSRG